jgi:hypothetical protein
VKWNSPQHFYDTGCPGIQSTSAWAGVERTDHLYLVQDGMTRDRSFSPGYAGAFLEIVGGPWQSPGAYYPLDGTLPYDTTHRYSFFVFIENDQDINFSVIDLNSGAPLISADAISTSGALQYLGDRGMARQERVTFKSGSLWYVSRYEAFTGSGGGGSDLFEAAQVHRPSVGWYNFADLSYGSVQMHDDTTNSTLDTPGRLNPSSNFYTNRYACGTVELADIHP